MTYEIVKEIGTQNTGTLIRESFLVKLDPAVVSREAKTYDLYEVDHVIVETLQILDDGIVYSETHVVASDDAGRIYESILYQVPATLTVPEALFGLGVHNYDGAIEDPDYDFSKLDDSNDKD